MEILLFGLFFGLAFLGIPLAIALLLGAGIPLLIFTDTPLTVLVQRIFVSMDSFSLMALPFFMIAGNIMSAGGVSRRIVMFANSIVGGFHGGLAIVAFFASAIFGAISGSATATVVAMGSILVPAMIEEGYGMRFSLATIASAGYLGTIIPPSIPMITYGVSTGASIGDLFAGGILPGILLACLMSVYAYFYGKKHIETTHTFSLTNVFKSLKEAAWALLMPIIIVGGIYSGIYTPTESAAVACLYGALVGFFIYRELNIKTFIDAIRKSVLDASMIMFIVGVAAVFGFVMTQARIPIKLSEFIVQLTDSKVVFLLLVTVLLLFMGLFLETNAAILIVAPIFLPMLETFDIDPVHFGILLIVNLSVGMITPPLGVNLFVATKLVEGATVKDILNIHLFIFLGISLVGILLVTYLPEIALFLPNLSK